MRQFTRTLAIAARSQGLHMIACEIAAWHTSASLLIQENADPDVMRDLNEHGTCRMASDPKRRARCNEAPNVFRHRRLRLPTTSSEKNPTLTIFALSWRATDYFAAELKASRL